MRLFRMTRARRAETEADRLKALAVLKATYQQEKAWVIDVEPMFPASDLERDDIAWFLASHRGEPVGVLRVLYAPPIEEYLRYDLKPEGDGIDVEALIRSRTVAEVGRFAVIPTRRKGITVVMSLMRAATRDIVSKGYTQLVTDVFENEPNSPLHFHTSIVGFRKVATHEVGELRYKGRRITLLLDIKVAYKALKAQGNWFFRAMTLGWSAQMHDQLAA